MQELSIFVEQEDALIGVLTVRESVRLSLELQYAALITHLWPNLWNLLSLFFLQISNPNLPRKEVNARVQRVLSVMGLLSCAEQRIGTAISRGISGGKFLPLDPDFQCDLRVISLRSKTTCYSCLCYGYLSVRVCKFRSMPFGSFYSKIWNFISKIFFLDEVTSGVCVFELPFPWLGLTPLGRSYSWIVRLPEKWWQPFAI